MEAQDKARQDLAMYKQEHILADVDKLKGQDLENFNTSLNEIDFGLMDMLYNELILHPSGDDLGSDITPMKNKFRLNNFTNEEIEKLRQTGLELISQGKVGIVLLSGGQGTRLGFDHAKGMYNIGMPSGKSLFEYFANRIARINEIACQAFNVTGKKPSLTWYVMTSEMNHSEIIGYFTQKDYFGLGQENVKFFTQQSLPALHLDGKIMLEEENKINMSPNGNGGLFHSLLRHGILKDMRDRGIKYVHIFGVDNVLAKPADPLFIGFTHANDYDVACKFVPKKSPTERVGVHVLHSGKPHVVEYSEITEEMAHRRDEQGTLVFDASHIVNSVYNIDFLDYVATHGSKELIKKYHIAKKKIKYYDVNTKQVVNPSDINGYKFELFIFDVFLLAKPEKFGLIEVKREEEFAPVKNAPGAADDSPDTARELLTTLHQKWLEERGVKFDNKASKEEGALFEIDTAKVYDAKDPRLNDIAEKHKDASIKLPSFLTE